MSAYVPYMIVMAAVTYLIRMLPLTLFQKEIKSVFLRSFLYYVPYAVLGAMTFPAIFTAGGDCIPSLIGTTIAMYLAYREKGLLTVAISACIAVYVAQSVITLLS